MYYACLLLLSSVLPVFSMEKNSEGMEVTTIIQQGHYIYDFDITADGKYLVSTDIDGASIAIWDLEKRRISKLISQPNDKRIRCHHLNPEIVYVANPTAGVPDDRWYYGLNIFTGEHTGTILGKDLPERHTYHDDYILRKNNGRIYIKSRRSKQDIGVLDGYNNSYRYGGLAVNINDSLVALSGMKPVVWDMKNLKISSEIPYLEFLQLDSDLMFPKSVGGIPIPKAGKPNIPYARMFYIDPLNWDADRFYHHYAYQDHFQCYFDDNNDLWLGGYNKWITKWTLSGDLKLKIPIEGAPIYSILSNGNDLVAATYEGVGMLNQKKKKVSLVQEYSKSDIKVTYGLSRLFGDGLFATADDGGYIRIGKVGEQTSSSVLFKFSDPAKVIAMHAVDVSKDDKRILASGQIATLCEISIDNPKNYTYYNTDNFNLDVIWNSIYLDNMRFVTTDAGGRVAFWTSGQRNPRNIYQNHRKGAVGARISNDGKRIFTSDEGGSITVWDSEKETPILNAYNFNQGKDFVFLTPDNYYKASKGALPGVHFAKGLDIYPIEQFDLKYNRPDIVMQRLGMNEEVIAPYYLAWRKRLRQMGYTEQMLGEEIHVPFVEINNVENINGTTVNPILNLDISVSDTKYPLHKFFINLNGVPLKGKNGMDLSGLVTSLYEEKVDVELCEGNNFIEVFAINNRGAESFRQTIDITYEPSVKKRKTLYVAAIGVSKYADNSFNLEYAAKDACDIIDLFKTTDEGSLYEYVSVKTMLLCDNLFGLDSLKGISEFFSQAGRDDSIVLFYAGHGILDDDMNYYLSHYDIDFNNPEKNGITFDKFESVIANSKALNRLFLIDACHSGEIDKEDYSSETLSMEAGKVKFRSIDSSIRKLKGYGVARTQALFNELFMDIRWGIGATIVSSAGGMEAAMEGEKWSNGLFTWCLKKGVADSCADMDGDDHVSVSELGNYLCNEVSKLSQGRQTPTLRAQNSKNNFFIK